MQLLWAWLVILIIEGVIFYQAQRKLFGMTWQASGSRFLAYALAMPGTVLHEGAHYLACKLLGVAVGRVQLFRPRQGEDGSITLGFVEHAEADPLRSTLVAIAPLLLVPPLLIGVFALLLGSQVVQEPLEAFLQAQWYLKLAALYILFSAAAAAFPSPGDHIPLMGWPLLAVLIAFLALVFSEAQLLEASRFLALVCLPAAVAALLQFLLLRWKLANF